MYFRKCIYTCFLLLLLLQLKCKSLPSMNMILRTLGNVSHIVSVCSLIISIGRPLRSCQWVLLPSPESRPIHQQISYIAPISPFGSLVTRKFGRRLNDMTAVTRALYHFGVFWVYGLLIKPACNELSAREWAGRGRVTYRNYLPIG